MLEKKERLKVIVGVYGHGDRKRKEKMKLVLAMRKVMRDLFHVEGLNPVVGEVEVPGWKRHCEAVSSEVMDKKGFVKKYGEVGGGGGGGKG